MYVLGMLALRQIAVYAPVTMAYTLSYQVNKAKNGPKWPKIGHFSPLNLIFFISFALILCPYPHNAYSWQFHLLTLVLLCSLPLVTKQTMKN